MREQGPAVIVCFENTGCALVDLAADPDCGESRLHLSVETWGRQSLCLLVVALVCKCFQDVPGQCCAYTVPAFVAVNDSGTVSQSASNKAIGCRQRKDAHFHTWLSLQDSRTEGFMGGGGEALSSQVSESDGSARCVKKEGREGRRLKLRRRHGTAMAHGAAWASQAGGAIAVTTCSLHYSTSLLSSSVRLGTAGELDITAHIDQQGFLEIY